MIHRNKIQIFYHDDELNMLSTYRIMFQMGIFDCIHLAVHAASGIFTIISAFGIQIGNLFAINKVRKQFDRSAMTHR
jgi:hypothetical protein